MKVPPPVTCRLSRTGGSSCFVLDSKAKLSECKFQSKQLPQLRLDDYTSSFSGCVLKTKKLADVFIASTGNYSSAGGVIQARTCTQLLRQLKPGFSWNVRHQGPDFGTYRRRPFIAASTMSWTEYLNKGHKSIVFLMYFGQERRNQCITHGTTGGSNWNKFLSQ